MDITYKTDPRTGRERPREASTSERPGVVRVVPKNDDLRRFLKHGLTRVGFLAEGSAEWPMDQFTKRRLKDGDITIEQAAPPPEVEPGQSKPGAGKAPIEATGAKSPAPDSDTSAAVDPNKTSAPHPTATQSR
jgi:hypothetical protein